MDSLVTDYQELEKSKSRPLGADARRVVYIPRDDRMACKPDKKIAQAHWDAPPATKPVPWGAPNLIGRTFGRFKVVGYLDSLKDGGAAWLVRCACGRYEHRRSRAVLNPKNKADCCQPCRHVFHLKRTDYRVRTGKNKPIEEFF